MKITVKKWTKGNLTRYYLTENNQSLGYVQELSDFNCTKEVISHTIDNLQVLEAVSVVNLAGELEPSTPLLNKHSGTYSVVIGKRNPVWVDASPIILN